MRKKIVSTFATFDEQVDEKEREIEKKQSRRAQPVIHAEDNNNEKKERKKEEHRNVRKENPN